MIVSDSAPLSQFLEKGFAAREYFSHRAAIVRKLYPDTLLLLENRGMMPAKLEACQFRQLNLYSRDTTGLPDELFTDPTINWHGQQLGEKGLIAAAGLCIQDSALWISVMQSDLCQQLFRHAALKSECKTQVEKRFGAWYKYLFNAILDFAAESGIGTVYCPTAEYILKATKTFVYPELFRRIYDFAGEFHGGRRAISGSAEYWELPVARNAGRIVPLVPVEAPELCPGPLICIFHDIEENIDTDVCAQECRRNLTRMLECERTAGVRATYNVVGKLYAPNRDEIRASGPHAMAFHSYDHVIGNDRQLRRCREADLQLRGYRPPRSVVTPELANYRLAYYNFEWLASGVSSLAKASPGSREAFAAGCSCLEGGIVKIPIAMDDYPLATGTVDYPEWRHRLLDRAEARPVLAFSLHDCYAGHWIDAYAELLDRISNLGRFVTADELCDLTFWRQG